MQLINSHFYLKSQHIVAQKINSARFGLLSNLVTKILANIRNDTDMQYPFAIKWAYNGAIRTGWVTKMSLEPEWESEKS